MSGGVILGTIIGGALGIAATLFFRWLAEAMNPPPKQDDANPWMFEETDPYIIELQQKIAKAREKHKPVIPLLIKLNHARHEALRKEMAQ